MRDETIHDTMRRILEDERQEAVEENRIEIANNMIKKGIPIKLIAKITKLDLNLVKRLVRIQEVVEKVREGIRQEAVEEAVEERNMKIADNMIKKGFPTDQIAEIIKLDLNAVEQLRFGK